MIDLPATGYRVVSAADPQVITVPDPDTVSPGFLGFMVMFLLAVVTVVLIRSMVAHLRKVRYSPEPEEQPSDQPAEPGRPGRRP